MTDPNICALCEFVITELDHRLEENKTEEAIKQALENICGYMPKTVRKDCTRLVDAYADQILEMLLADLTPDEVCAALKFCKPKINDGTRQIHVKTPNVKIKYIFYCSHRFQN